MALDTYDGLKVSIADEIDRDDLTDKIDDFIDLAEARHRRDIRIVEMLTRVNVTIDDRYLALPDGFLQAQILRILTNEAGQDIMPYTLNEVNIFELTRRSQRFKRPPQFFNNHGNEIEFETVPDQSYGGEMVYYKQLDPLSDSNQTNALLTRSPDTYLYGACLASAPYLRDDERISVWGDLYAVAVNGLTDEDQDARFAGPIFARVAGTTP